MHFGTKHGKAEVILPLLLDLGIKCETVVVDTDILGTFTGEIPRKGSVRETLRGKVKLVQAIYPNSELILASEGSFGPHPLIGTIQSNLESLFLYDSVNDIEIYVEELSSQTNHSELDIGPQDDFDLFLENAMFPDHHLIVRPLDKMPPIYKGVKSKIELEKFILDSFLQSEIGKVKISTDMRANHNPSRMKVIEMAGRKIVDALISFCPECNLPGFMIVRGVQGLICSGCETPSKVARSVVWSCRKCSFELEKPRPDGLRYLNPSECEYCNP